MARSHRRAHARAESDTNRRADARTNTGGNARTNRRRGSPAEGRAGEAPRNSRGTARDDAQRNYRGDSGASALGDTRGDARDDARRGTRGKPRGNARDDTRVDTRRNSPRGSGGSARGDARTEPRRGPRPGSRFLSQNFLAGPAVAERVVRIAAPEPDGLLVVEVGAGTGALTEALAPHCRELIAYEIDRRLLGVLRARLAAHAHVRVVGRDFLAARPPLEPFAVVGNVPYARTSEIVDWCLRAPRLDSATFITQREYARKRTGDFGRWSLLTVRTWPWHEWRLCGRVPRECFRPVPRVDSAVLRIERRRRPLLPRGEEAAYRRMVEAGFGGAGGTLFASLRRAGYPPARLTAAFRTAALPKDTVVAFATPAQWLTLHRMLHPR